MKGWKIPSGLLPWRATGGQEETKHSVIGQLSSDWASSDGWKLICHLFLNPLLNTSE